MNDLRQSNQRYIQMIDDLENEKAKMKNQVTEYLQGLNQYEDFI